MTEFILLLSFLLCISCGKSIEDDVTEEREEVEDTEGTYMALLFPVNQKISTHVNGEVRISKYGDDFKVELKLKNAPPGIHRQYLHTGSKCPKSLHDYNRDGYLDVYESNKVMGQMILPLDHDLSRQMSHDRFPSGNYHYRASTSYYLMLHDLHLPDEITNDQFVKLSERELPLERRVVSVYGARTGQGGDVPIACGVLTLISYEETPSTDTWDPPYQEHRPTRPVPRPRPDPEPVPEVQNPPERSWWDWLRQRWRNWRDRDY